MSAQKYLACLALLSLLACTPLPEFPRLQTGAAPETEQAAYPALLPVEDRGGDAGEHAETVARITSNLQLRIVGLQARAERLRRGAVIDAGTRARMHQGVKTR